MHFKMGLLIRTERVHMFYKHFFITKIAWLLQILQKENTSTELTIFLFEIYGKKLKRAENGSKLTLPFCPGQTFW